MYESRTLVVLALWVYACWRSRVEEARELGNPRRNRGSDVLRRFGFVYQGVLVNVLQQPGAGGGNDAVCFMADTGNMKKLRRDKCVRLHRPLSGVFGGFFAACASVDECGVAFKPPPVRWILRIYGRFQRNENVLHRLVGNKFDRQRHLLGIEAQPVKGTWFWRRWSRMFLDPTYIRICARTTKLPPPPPPKTKTAPSCSGFSVEETATIFSSEWTARRGCYFGPRSPSRPLLLLHLAGKRLTNRLNALSADSCARRRLRDTTTVHMSEQASLEISQQSLFYTLNR